jgi:Mor family transcriptional regulator
MKFNEYKLDNGWVVAKGIDNIVILHVMPIPDSIFRKEMNIEIPNSIYNEIELGERRVTELFRKYNLHELIFQWDREPVISKKNINTKNEFYGIDFLATCEGKCYFLEYELSQHGGGHRKIRINKEIYETARHGELSISDLIKKFNLILT